MKIRLDDVMQSLSYPFRAVYYYYIPLETVLMFMDGKIYGKAVQGIATVEDVRRHSDEFIKLPALGEAGLEKVRKGFVRSLPKGDTRKKLKEIIEAGDQDEARSFEETARDAGLLIQWYLYRDEVFREFSRRWCEGMKLEYIE